MDYDNGTGELETISACIEDLLDSAGIRGFIYLEKDGCENISSDAVILDDDPDEMFDEVKLNALSSVILDLLNDHTDYKIIDTIFRTVYNTIFESDDGDQDEITDKKK